LSNKASSTLVGLWFLVAEHLRLGSWDLIKGYTGGDNASLEPRIAIQMVNEASLCKTRVRRKNYITHQGFELLNGLGFLTTDEQVHELLARQTVSEAQSLQETLSLIRLNRGHYTGSTIAIDPHRIISTTKRTMPKKKKQPNEPSRKMLQTFFALDTGSGQPIGFGIGSPSVNTTKATIDLLKMVNKIGQKALILADKEHFTNDLARYMKQETQFDFLIPVTSSKRIQKIERSLSFQPLWAGYAIAETSFHFAGSKEKYRLLVQRECEVESQYNYRSFLALSDKPASILLSEKYPERYGKMSLAMLAQAATYQLRQKLPKPYNRWNAIHLADAIFSKFDGAISAKDDTITVTCYNVPEELKLHQHYQDLPEKLISEGIDPRVPWFYDFKLDFRFK